MDLLGCGAEPEEMGNGVNFKGYMPSLLPAGALSAYCSAPHKNQLPVTVLSPQTWILQPPCLSKHDELYVL